MHRDRCPYYAPRFYLEHPKAISDGFVSVVSLDPSHEAVLHALQRGPYGRCVYQCEDVYKRQAYLWFRLQRMYPPGSSSEEKIL